MVTPAPGSPTPTSSSRHTVAVAVAALLEGLLSDPNFVDRALTDLLLFGLQSAEPDDLRTVISQVLTTRDSPAAVKSPLARIGYRSSSGCDPQ